MALVVLSVDMGYDGLLPLGVYVSRAEAEVAAAEYAANQGGETLFAYNDFVLGASAV